MHTPCCRGERPLARTGYGIRPVKYEIKKMITSATKIRDYIFELDMPTEEMQPRQAMILKKQVLCILKDWQNEWEIERHKK